MKNNGRLLPSSRAVDRTLVAAFDEMVRKRPLRPPPMPREVGRVRSAGALEYEREKRLGLHDVSSLWVVR